MTQVQTPKHCFKDCFIALPGIKPDTSLRTKFGNNKTIEANIIINKVSYKLTATGGGSDLEVVVMYGKTKDNKERTHWGLLLKQWGGWMLNKKTRKTLLIHHLGGNGVQIAVACTDCARKVVLSCYGKEVPKPGIKVFDYGVSQAALWRFLDDKSLGRNCRYEYSNKYRHGDVYFQWRQSNCFRLVWDMLTFICLNYELGVAIQIKSEGNEKWEKNVKLMLTKHPEFVKSIRNMYFNMTKDKNFDKIVKLLDGQYHVGKLAKIYDKMYL